MSNALEKLVEAAVMAMVEQLGAERALVAWAPGSKSEAIGEYGLESFEFWHDQSLPQSVFRRVIKGGSPVYYENADKLNAGQGSLVCVPVYRGPQVMGFFYCDHSEPGGLKPDIEKEVTRLVELFEVRLTELKMREDQSSPILDFLNRVHGRLEERLQERRSPLKTPLRPGELRTLIGQLATMTSAGLGLIKALQILAELYQSRVGQAAGLLLEKIETGHSLSSAASSLPGFDPVVARTLRAAEESGSLHLALQRLTERLVQLDDIRGRLKAALVYPAVLLCVSLALVGAILWLLLPQFLDIFASLGGELPAPTRLLLQMNTTAFKIGAAVLGLGLFFLARVKTVKDWLTYGAPLWGGCNRDLALMTLCSQLSTMIDAGVPLHRALELVSASTHYSRYRKALLAVRKNLSEGLDLLEAFQKSAAFPTVVLSMIEVGVESGKLAGCLNHTAQLAQQDFEFRLESLLGMLEPLMLLFMGSLVGFVVVACLLPIYQTATLQV